MTQKTTPWEWVTPLDGSIPDHLRDQLQTVDSLRNAWDDAIAVMPRAEFEQARKRSLRRHAIETGIIERLYDVDWGVTEALVAEGVTAEVAARSGGLDDEALLTIRTQLDALEFLAATAQGGRPLTVQLIRELHIAITRSQAVYEATDSLGRKVLVPLHHGEWKTQPNHVERPDGTLLEYTPPEHVHAEMERLVEFYRAATDEHPVVCAAWLHHQFVRIHPFEDGNGRVARALTMLVLLEGHYAPLVVDRRLRGDYLEALDSANAGDLNPLIRLFARLEIAALRSELAPPAPSMPQPSPAVSVAKAHVERLVSLRRTTDAERAERATLLASAVHGRIQQFLVDQSAQLVQAFVAIDPKSDAFTTTGQPGQPNARYWRIQLIRTANAVDFFTNLADGSWWVQLKLRVLDQTLRYVAAVQKVGRGETGVLALTVFAELLPSEEEKEAASNGLEPTSVFTPTTEDSVTFVLSDTVDRRWPEAADLLERTLSAAVDTLARGLSA
jgi:hypothetical protein